MTGFRHIRQFFTGRITVRTPRLSSSSHVSFNGVLFISANPDISDRVRASVSMTGHTVFGAESPPLFPLSTVRPDQYPFIECKQERDSTSRGGTFMFVVCGRIWVFFFSPDRPLSLFGSCLHGSHGGTMSACSRHVYLTVLRVIFFLKGSVLFPVRFAPRFFPLTLVSVKRLAFDSCWFMRLMIDVIIDAASFRVFIWHQLRSLVRTGFGVRAGVGAETLAPSRLYHNEVAV